MSTKLTLPTIHLNGTSRSVLMKDYRTALDAVNNAVNATQETGPNGRDYYPVDGSMQKALAENRARVDRLVAVRDELMEIIQGIRA